jgi:rare lipoprotein A
MGELVLHKKMLMSYYADKFHGRRTASGVPFDRDKYTAAHKKLPLELN